MSLTLVLEALLSPTDAVRSQAEVAYESACADLPAVTAALVQALVSEPEDARRIMAAVLFRKLLGRKVPGSTASVWESLPADAQTATKAGLLLAFANEPKDGVRHKLCHAIAETATYAAGPGSQRWQELLPLVFEQARSPEPRARKTAMILFSKLAEYAGDVILVPHASTLLSLLPPLLCDSDNGTRIAAMQGTIALLIAIESDAARQPFQAVIPLMMKALELALREDEQMAQEAIRALMGIVEAHPSFMNPYILPAAEAMLVIGSHEEFDADTRSVAIEFLLVYADAASSSVRKVPVVIKAVIDMSLALLVSKVEDDPTWASKEEDFNSYLGEEGGSDSDDAEMSSTASAALARIADSIGGASVWPLFSEASQNLLRSRDWKQERAALLGLSLVASGCKKELMPQIKAVVQGVLPYFNSAHPRVRHAAIRCIGQLVLDFSDPTAMPTADGPEAVLGDAPSASAAKTGGGGGGRMGKARESKAPKSIQESCGGAILNALVAAAGAQNAAAPRLRGLAAASLVNFCGEGTCPDSVLGPMLRPLLEALFAVIRDVPQKSVLEVTMTAIGVIAQAAGDGFAQFYDVFTPLAKGVIASCTTPEKALLRGRALECVALICAAVGKERSGMDAAEILNTLVRAQHADVSDDDGVSYMYTVSSIARLAFTLGADFAPYLPFVMPKLLETASKEIEIEITTTPLHAATSISGAGASPDKAPGAGITTISMTIKDTETHVAINSKVLSERKSAIEAVVHFVTDLGDEVPAFWPYIDACLKALLGSINVPITDIAEEALSGLHSVLIAALADVTDAGHAQRTLEAIVPALLSRLSDDHNLESLWLTGSSLCEVMREAHASSSDGKAVRVSLPAPSVSTSEEDADVPAPHTLAMLPIALVEPLFTAVLKAIQACIERRGEALKAFGANPDVDDEDKLRFLQSLAGEDEFISHCTDAIGYVIKQHGAVTLAPIASTGLGPFLVAYLTDTKQVNEQMRCAALCLCDDLIEHASPESHTLLGAFLPALLEAVKFTNEPVVRQPALYGVGVCAVSAGPQFDAYAGEAAKRLIACVQAPGARNEDNECCTDNAICALIKIATWRSSAHGVDADAIMRGVLSYLPIKADRIEAVVVHAWLVTALGTGDELWLGRSKSRLGAVLCAIAGALLAHKAAIEGNVFNSEADDADGEDDEEEEEEEGELITEATLQELRTVVEGIKASPALSAQVIPVVRSLKKKHRAALAEFGLV